MDTYTNENDSSQSSKVNLSEIDVNEAHRFLEILDPTTKEFTFQTYPDYDNKNSKLTKVLHGTFEEHSRALTSLNKRGAAITVMVNAGDLKGREIENIKKVRAHFADADKVPLDTIKNFKWKSHLVVESSPGNYQPYYFIDYAPCNPEVFRPFQDGLAVSLGCTIGTLEEGTIRSAVGDISRVMRLPGFLHQKDPDQPFMVRIVEENNFPHYQMGCEPFSLTPFDLEIQQATPTLRFNGEAQNSNGAVKPREWHTKIYEGEGRNNKCCRLVGTLVAKGMGVEAINEFIWEWNARCCKPPLDEGELGQAIDSIIKGHRRRHDDGSSIEVGQSANSSESAKTEETKVNGNEVTSRELAGRILEVEKDNVIPFKKKADIEVEDAKSKIAKFAKLDIVEQGLRKKAFAKELGMKIPDLEDAIKKIKQIKEAIELPPPPTPEELYALAKDIIEDKNILELFSMEIGLEVVGEEKLCKQIYLCNSSRLLDGVSQNAIHYGIENVSATGKSYTRGKVLNHFPEEHRLDFTSMSDKAFYYLDACQDYKIFTMGELSTTEYNQAFVEMLRQFLSEGQIKRLISEKNEDTGKLGWVEKVVKGQIVFSSTSTQVSIDHELNTRLLILHADESPEQTRRVIRHDAKVLGRHENEGKIDYEPWKNYQRWLLTGNRRVYVEFAPAIANLVPFNAVRIRRDFPKLRILIQTHALLHRQHREKTAEGYIVATIEDDYAPILKIFGESFSEASEQKVSDALMETRIAVKELIEANNSNKAEYDDLRKKMANKRVGDSDPDEESKPAPTFGVTKYDLSTKLGIKDHNTAKQRLKRAAAKGLIRNINPPRTEGKYILGDKDIDQVEMLPSVDEVKEEWERIKHRFTKDTGNICSIENEI